MGPTSRVEGEDGRDHTTSELLSRIREVLSTKLIRETCLQCALGSGGLRGLLQATKESASFPMTLNVSDRSRERPYAVGGAE